MPSQSKHGRVPPSKITNPHVGANESGGATAHRHAICCTVKSATGTLILCLANKVKGGEGIMPRRQTPLEVMFSLFKTSFTLSHRALAEPLLSDRPLTNGRPTAQMAQDTSWLSRTIVHSKPGSLRRSLLFRLVLCIESNPAQATGKRVFERRHLYHDCGSD